MFNFFFKVFDIENLHFTTSEMQLSHICNCKYVTNAISYIFNVIIYISYNLHVH